MKNTQAFDAKLSNKFAKAIKYYKLNLIKR